MIHPPLRPRPPLTLLQRIRAGVAVITEAVVLLAVGAAILVVAPVILAVAILVAGVEALIKRD